LLLLFVTFMHGIYNCIYKTNLTLWNVILQLLCGKYLHYMKCFFSLRIILYFVIWLVLSTLCAQCYVPCFLWVLDIALPIYVFHTLSVWYYDGSIFPCFWYHFSTRLFFICWFPKVLLCLHVLLPILSSHVRTCVPTLIVPQFHWLWLTVLENAHIHISLCIVPLPIVACWYNVFYWVVIFFI
jgi:hypothetical protein